MWTPQKEKFAQCVALEGMSYSDAYRASYKTKTKNDKTVHDNASQLKDDTEVAQRIAELREQIISPKIMTAKERLEWLTEVIEDENQSMNDRLKASDQMNKMQGEYVTKVEGNLNVKLEDLL